MANPYTKGRLKSLGGKSLGDFWDITPPNIPATITAPTPAEQAVFTQMDSSITPQTMSNAPYVVTNTITSNLPLIAGIGVVLLLIVMSKGRR